jgi:hypothetical protein
MGRTVSGSLDEVLRAREGEQPERKRTAQKSNGEVTLVGEGEERHNQMLALMSSSPPSSGPADPFDEDDDAEDDDDDYDDDDEEVQMNNKGNVKMSKPLQRSIGLGHPIPFQLGRATSLDFAAASSRARHIFPTPRVASGPTASLTSVNFRTAHKRQLPPVPTHSIEHTSKRIRPNPAFKPRDSFSRSQSDAVLNGPPTSPLVPSDAGGETPFSKGSRGLRASMSLDMDHLSRSGSVWAIEGGEGRSVYSKPEEDADRAGGVAIAQAKGDKTKVGKKTEADDEVMGAAQSLLEMFGSTSQTSQTSQDGDEGRKSPV